MAKQAASELRDLDVDRVDGVDKPATGRQFALFKSQSGTGESHMNQYAMLATAADQLLKSIRKDAGARVSKSTAIAINGLAQVMQAEAVFVSKAVPTQPYEFTEPEVNGRGPADENLGGNFTPRSMPGSMVGKVEFRMKDEDEQDAKAKRGPKMYDEDEEDGKGKGKAKAAKDEDADEDDKKAKARKDESGEDRRDASERANSDIMRAVKAQGDTMAAAIAELTTTIKGVVGKSEPVEKDETAEPVRKSRPASRQVADESGEELEPVRKAGRHFGVSFGNVVFDQGRK